MCILGVVATSSSPFMTSIAFVAMILKGHFSMENAFTTMYLFNYLAVTVVSLPMIISFVSEAMISSQRILAFLSLPEIDEGIVVNSTEIN